MITHVVCLDGTGQVYRQDHPTNIALIFGALGGMVSDGGAGSLESSLTLAGREVQRGKYLPGVGTRGVPILQKLEQSVGAGIAEHVVRGYTFLSRNVGPGDEIVIVGFSRGAAAARCLAGFVAKQGLLHPGTYDPGDKTAAYRRGIAAWYQYRAGHPHLARESTLTTIFAPGELPRLGPADYLEVERIKAVGVFDTVSSMGIPHFDASGWLGYDFVLADTDLSPKVLNGFHALAADEDRANFLPTYWTPRSNVTQVIFPGNHSDVGGGYGETGLSDGALAWMLEKLAGQGVRLDRTLIRAIEPQPNGVAHDDGGVWPWVVLPKAPRVFPVDLFAGEAAFTIDKSVRLRWGETVSLLPGSRSTAYQALGRFFGGKVLFSG